MAIKPQDRSIISNIHQNQYEQFVRTRIGRHSSLLLSRHLIHRINPQVILRDSDIDHSSITDSD